MGNAGIVSLVKTVSGGSGKKKEGSVGKDDSTTRRLFEWILGEEKEHADDMSDLLKSFNGEKKA